MKMYGNAEVQDVRAGTEVSGWRPLQILAAAGIIGPLLFAATFIVQGLFRPTYSHIAEPVSALAAGPNGWVQDINFLVFGPLMIAFAVGLHLGVRPTRFGLVGPLLLMVSGVGLVLAGVFPARDDSGTFVVGPGHALAALASFLGAGTGYIVSSRRMARDARWARLASYVLVSGIAITVLFLGTGALAVGDDAPLHPWAELMQRATFAVWLVCNIVLGRQLLRVTVRE